MTIICMSNVDSFTITPTASGVCVRNWKVMACMLCHLPTSRSNYVGAGM